MQKSVLICITNDIKYDQRILRIATSLSIAGYQVSIAHQNKYIASITTTYTFTCIPISCFFIKGVFFYAEYNLKLAWLILNGKWDIVTACDLDTLFPVAFLKGIKKFSAVFDAHEYFEEVPELQGKPFKKWVWERVAKYGIPKMDLAYTVSQTLADALHKKYNYYFNVIRNLPIRSELPNTKPVLDNTIRLYYQGAVNVGRGLEQLFLALTVLPKHVEFHIAGSGDIVEELKVLSKKLEIESRVFWYGMLSKSELDALAHSMHMGINILESQSLSYYVSAANKAYDYIQQGLPALHSNFPEYTQLIYKFKIGYIVHSLQQEDISKAIKYCLDESVYSQMKQACIVAANELHWGFEVEKLKQLYNRFSDLQSN